MRIVACAWQAVALLIAGLAGSAAAGDAESPLKNAKPGDWAKYEIVNVFGEENTVLFDIVSNDGKTAKIRTISWESEAGFLEEAYGDNVEVKAFS